MKLLADENIPRASIRYLRDRGYDISAVAGTTPGLDDVAVLLRAAQEERVLVTFDRDHTKLLYAQQVPPPPGLIYLRFRPRSPTEPGELLEKLLSRGDDAVLGCIIVLERERFRRRHLP